MKYRRVIVNRKRQLEMVNDDLPTPRCGEVRLKMLAAGVSLPDVMMKSLAPPELATVPVTKSVSGKVMLGMPGCLANTVAPTSPR